MNILVDAHEGLGDSVQLVPVIRNLKENYPSAKIGIIIENNGEKIIFEHSGIMIDKYIYLHRPKNGIVNFIKFIIEVRKFHSTYIIYPFIMDNKFAHVLALLFNSKKNLGVQFQSELKKYDEKINRVDWNLEIIRQICPKLHMYTPKLHIEIDQYKNDLIAQVKEKDILIGICIGEGTPIKYYHKGKKISVTMRGIPYIKLRQIIKSLISDGFVICLIGGKYEEEHFLKYYSDLVDNKKVLNFVGNSMLEDSMIIAKKCKVVLGCDTGMIHIADALGVRTLSIFGPTNPLVHGARSSKARFIIGNESCQFCFGTSMYIKCPKRKCLSNISTNRILHEIKDIIANEEK